MAYCFVVFIWVYFIYVGSVYRYYESRRRLFLESSNPERNKQAEKNREATKLYNRQTSDLSLKNSWAAYGPGNSNRLEIGVID